MSPLLYSTQAPQHPNFHSENVQALLSNSLVELQMMGAQSKYSSSLRLPAFQACSNRSISLFSTGVKGKCGQLGRITTACCAERYV